MPFFSTLFIYVKKNRKDVYPIIYIRSEKIMYCTPVLPNFQSKSNQFTKTKECHLMHHLKLEKYIHIHIFLWTYTPKSQKSLKIFHHVISYLKIIIRTYLGN